MIGDENAISQEKQVPGSIRRREVEGADQSGGRLRVFNPQISYGDC